MGNFVGKAMEDSMQRNQQFMTEINRFVWRYLKGTFVLIMIKFRTTLERQIQMQDQMRERAVAMQVSNLAGAKS